eukprot:g11773.t1
MQAQVYVMPILLLSVAIWGMPTAAFNAGNSSEIVRRAAQPGRGVISARVQPQGEGIFPRQSQDLSIPADLVSFTFEEGLSFRYFLCRFQETLNWRPETRMMTEAQKMRNLVQLGRILTPAN